ncbi:Sybindin-like protein [Globomyces pollinis-pini]|nr:Sybindin-like protein [Globomyces pollinis-pini]
MTIYGLYIFDRHCNCIFYQPWNSTTSLQSDLNQKQSQEDSKLVFGVMFNLGKIIAKLNPVKTPESFITYRTDSYKLHYYETPACLKFVLLSDIEMANTKGVLHSIFSDIYVPYVSKNPMIPFDAPINNDLFRSHLNKFIKSLPNFEPKQ